MERYHLSNSVQVGKREIQIITNSYEYSYNHLAAANYTTSYQNDIMIFNYSSLENPLDPYWLDLDTLDSWQFVYRTLIKVLKEGTKQPYIYLMYMANGNFFRRASFPFKSQEKLLQV